MTDHNSHRVMSLEARPTFPNNRRANYKLVAEPETAGYTLGFVDWLNVGGVRVAGGREEPLYFAGDLIVDFCDDGRGPHGEGGVFIRLEDGR